MACSIEGDPSKANILIDTHTHERKAKSCMRDSVFSVQHPVMPTDNAMDCIHMQHVVNVVIAQPISSDDVRSM